MPKFRTWLVMSGARKKTVAPGRSSGSRRRSSLTYSAVGWCPGLSWIIISPSADEIIDGSPIERLIPLIGRPTLSMTVSSSSLGMTSLTIASAWTNTCSVASMRVPGATRRWNRICPASTDGKKLPPEVGGK